MLFPRALLFLIYNNSIIVVTYLFKIIFYGDTIVNPGLIQKGLALTSQDLASAAQTDPNLAALQEYKMIAAKVSTTLSGIKGMRNATLINQAAEALPSPTEPRADQEAKINAIRKSSKKTKSLFLNPEKLIKIRQQLTLLCSNYLKWKLIERHFWLELEVE